MESMFWYEVLSKIFGELELEKTIDSLCNKVVTVVVKGILKEILFAFEKGSM